MHLNNGRLHCFVEGGVQRIRVHPRPNGNYVCLSAEDAVSQWSTGGNNHNIHKIVNSLCVCKISRRNVNGTMELIIMGNDEHVNK